MDMFAFHWVWYLVGLVFAPRLTIAIALTIYGKYIGIPAWLLVVVWILAVLINCLENKKRG